MIQAPKDSLARRHSSTEYGRDQIFEGDYRLTARLSVFQSSPAQSKVEASVQIK